MPYIIGVHSSIMQKLKVSELGDVVVLDADANTVHSEYDDLASLPSDVVSDFNTMSRLPACTRFLFVIRYPR